MHWRVPPRARGFVRESVRRIALAAQDSTGFAFTSVAARDQAIATAPHVARFFVRDERIKQPTGTVPPDAIAYLDNDNDVLRQLRRRYRGHPACNHSQWAPRNVASNLDLRYFRADNMFLYQTRRYSPLAFYATTSFAKRSDLTGLFDVLVEDDYFGPELFDFHGKAVSRDLLDSILEMNILCKHLPIATTPMTILDIGAGYGRLAHRLTAAFRNLRFYCVDAVPESTFISDYYLKFRNADRCTCVPLDELTRTPLQGVDLAINIHSFPECQSSVIEWWLAQLREMAVPWLFIGVAASLGLTSREADGRRRDFHPLIERAGYEVSAVVSKFAGSPTLQADGLYPTNYYLCRRRIG